jgi:putative phosphonate metabolism protein
LNTPRYAIYYAPPADGEFWRFGSSVLGYDAVTGRDIPFTIPPGCDAGTWPTLTEDPRRYGFHATLKAPFELAQGCTESDLVSFARTYASGIKGVRLSGLSVNSLGSFVALTPTAESVDLQIFALKLVQAFEPFRAPLGEADLARRLRHPLTAEQRTNLDCYGYPYVGDAFRFHMTLTGALPAEQVARVTRALTAAYTAAVSAGPVMIDRIGLFRQTTRGERFRLIEVYSFRS